MTDLTANLPTDCPACGREACGHVCDCGTLTHPRPDNGKPRSHTGWHRYCCSCGAHYLVPKGSLVVSGESHER